MTFYWILRKYFLLEILVAVHKYKNGNPSNGSENSRGEFKFRNRTKFYLEIIFLLNAKCSIMTNVSIWWKQNVFMTYKISQITVSNSYIKIIFVEKIISRFLNKIMQKVGKRPNPPQSKQPKPTKPSLKAVFWDRKRIFFSIKLLEGL